MKFTTLIPQTLNDGTPVSPETIRELLREVAVTFGGYSLEGTVQGYWIDPADGVHYQDNSLRVTIVCDNDLYDAAKELVLKIGKALGQKAMFFEVRDFDGVRFLPVP